MPRQVHSREMPYPDEHRLHVRLPGKLYKRLEELAEYEHRSLNSEIVFLLLRVAATTENRRRAEEEMRGYEE